MDEECKEILKEIINQQKIMNGYLEDIYDKLRELTGDKSVYQKYMQINKSPKL